MVQDQGWVEDTIVAIATPIGEGGIGIVRVSGAAAISTVDQAFLSPKGRSLASANNWSLSYGWIVSATGEKLDEVVVSVMRAPHSYTREDVVEINCHSGLVPLQNILQRMLELGARLAEPGEFTKRAFLHGRWDLSQAEAVIDIIRAKTDKGHRLAMRQLEGDVSKAVKAMRHDLVGLLAAIEAGIDFPEEVGDMEAEEVVALCQDLEEDLKALLATADSGKIIREGIDTAIIGRPNVGKSSLLNMLVRENRAIVTAIPGTTRDVIEEYMNIGGIPVKISDTAGIRKTDNVVEKIGVEKSKEKIDNSDLIILMLDSSKKLDDEDRKIIEYVDNKKYIILLNKIDLGDKIDLDSIHELNSKFVIKTSIKLGNGLDEVKNCIKKLFFKGEVRSEDLFVTNVRHKECLIRARKNCMEALDVLKNTPAIDLASIDMRNAWTNLGKITGDTLEENIIDKIFSKFCLGK